MVPAVQFEKVFFTYDETPVISNATFQIPRGQFAGIIGPNGGGKTTLLKLVLGFLDPTRGKVSVFGKAPAGSREKVAYVPQNLRYDRHFPISVLELILMGCMAHLPWWGRFSKADEEAAHRALETVGIANMKNHAVGTLSGGQFQRALIARALVSNPTLLILDEPTANVDTKAEQDIYQLLRTLAKDRTILMVTHDLRVAIEIVDSILLVQNEVSVIKPHEVCNHFAMGLYHPPIAEDK